MLKEFSVSLSKNLKTLTYKEDICNLMFIVSQLIVAKTWKQRKCPLIDNGIKNKWYIYIMVHICN